MLSAANLHSQGGKPAEHGGILDDESHVTQDAASGLVDLTTLPITQRLNARPRSHLTHLSPCMPGADNTRHRRRCAYKLKYSCRTIFNFSEARFLGTNWPSAWVLMTPS